MGQEIFNSTNELTPHQFVQNKFVQEFVTISLINFKRINKSMSSNPNSIRLISESNGIHPFTKWVNILQTQTYLIRIKSNRINES